ncbi:MAG: type II toxin-antitoxin system PemK/MazF family toxin [Pirellulales bacterium]|nr:type II toxin-antitoxin system PemK/MazF family toxin [Pirellulales bacterium]
MTKYRSGDLVLVAFPFSGGGPGKRRPALVIADAGDDNVVLARVTTQSTRTPLDVPLTDWQKSGLLAASVVRLHKLATIEKTLVSRTLGSISSVDRASVSKGLQQLLNDW